MNNTVGRKAMTIALLISIFVTVSLWEYCMFFRRQGRLPYVQGFAAFALILWLACAAGLVHAFGWLWGIASVVFAIAVLQYLFLGGPPHVLGEECTPIVGCPTVCSS